ncbi:MAG TPA: alpha/beta hydrolase [Afifellaceae bacterium]|nr:alpha/beta hydrolase [Afifellaceae bacterium]
MAHIDYASEYNNRARVPEHPAIIAGWARDAAAWRATAGGELDVPNGDSQRQRVDVFAPRQDQGCRLVLFIHGGYWQALDKDHFSHLAAGLNAHGVTVAVAGYDLCPSVAIRDIVGQMRRAAAFLYRRTGRRLVAAGHSAGGHLAAALVATDWPAIEPGLPRDLVPAGLAISGLFDLRPLVETPINEALRLDGTEARAMSPLFWEVPPGRRLEAWVGAEESGEYLRQSRTIVDTWAQAGARTRCQVVPGANHFTIVAQLADAASPMTAALLDMVEAAPR